MSRLKELNLKRIAFYALGILLCYAGITYMDTWLTKMNQELNDSFNTIDWFCETRIRVLKGNYLLVDTKKERIITKRTVAVCLINNKIYALGEGEYVVYDMETGREKVFIKDNNMHTDVIQPIQHIPEESYKLADKERVLSYSDFTKEQLQMLLTKIGNGVAQRIDELKSTSKNKVNEMIVFSKSMNYGLVIDLVPQSNMVYPYYMRIITALPQGANKTTRAGDKLVMMESETNKEYLFIEVE